MGSKEDILARRISLVLAAEFAVTVASSVGLHIDKANSEDIAELEQITENILAEIIVYLQNVYHNQ